MAFRFEGDLRVFRIASAAYPVFDGGGAAHGDVWYDAGAVAVLLVPSMLSPYEPNVLIDQSHPDFRTIEVSPERPVTIDPRLSRRTRGQLCSRQQ